MLRAGYPRRAPACPRPCVLSSPVHVCPGARQCYLTGTRLRGYQSLKRVGRLSESKNGLGGYQSPKHVALMYFKTSDEVLREHVKPPLRCLANALSVTVITGDARDMMTDASATACGVDVTLLALPFVHS